MAEYILDSALDGDLQTDIIIKWLLNEVSEENVDNVLKTCSTNEFVTYFLNTIHEEASRNQTTNETPTKSKSDTQIGSTMKTATTTTTTRACVFPITVIEPNIKKPLNKSSTFPPLNRSLDHSFGRSALFNSTPRQQTPIEATSPCSPISPLYKDSHNFSGNRRHADKSLCLGDFIVAGSGKKGAAGKRRSQRGSSEEAERLNCRRINPTSLNERARTNCGFLGSENSFDFGKDFKELEVESKEQQRSLLVQETQKIASGDVFKPVLNTQRKFSVGLGNRVEVIGEISEVKCKRQMDVLIEICSVILNKNLALNPCSEIYFIISLLLTKADKDNHVQTENRTFNLRISELFETIHNKIYFSTKVLETQADFLKALDRTTLKHLTENPNLQSFSPKLINELTATLSEKSETIIESDTLEASSRNTNVCFISDTDNRNNFPSDDTFHAFRKQRDLFYEILRIWETNRLKDGWNFSLSLGAKIKAVAALSSDPYNMMQLSRLFKGQLLNSCCDGLTNEDGVSEGQLSFLSSIPNVNLDKISRLKSRLVSKECKSGINSKPVFTEQQEFYKEFILCSPHVFLRHLNDCFVSEIVELNERKFVELEDSDDGTVDEPTRKKFLQTIKSLRILAKFLGFLEDLPYKSNITSTTTNITTKQISIRLKCRPPLDLTTLIKTATENRNLTLTIPWTVKYLSMLDTTTLHLPYYTDILQRLHTIYKRTVPSDFGTLEGYNLVRLSLGWLFDQPNFPEGLRLDAPEIETCCVSKRNSLDMQKIVDQGVLYGCCGYLGEIRRLLVSNCCYVTVKHIRPLTAVENQNESAKKRLESQLEEAFFNGQPVSVRKTVEFVSERVASACIKHVCNSVVPEFKQKAVKDWISELSNLKTENVPYDLFYEKSKIFALECLKAIRKKCIETSLEIINSRISKAIESLLALDVLPQTKEVCVSVATRMCFSRINQWINNHVTTDIFLKLFDSETHRFIRDGNKSARAKTAFTLPESSFDIPHDDSTSSAAHIVVRIQKISWKAFECPATITKDELTELLVDTKKSLECRCDVNDTIRNTINVMLVDLALLIVTHRTDLISADGILTSFASVWRTYHGDVDTLFKTLISRRNVMLLAQSQRPRDAWAALAELLVFLLAEGLLRDETLETQCVAIFRNEWYKDTLDHIKSCLEAIVRWDKTKRGGASKFSLLIDFLAEFSTNLDL